MNKHDVVIRLNHTDAAGILYFANLFVLAHQCYETLLEQWITPGKLIEQGQYLIPIAHAEADYLAPIKLSDKITIEITLSNFGTSSFELQCLFKNSSSKLLATVNTVHVMLDRSTGKPIPIPADLAKLLKQLPTEQNQ